MNEFLFIGKIGVITLSLKLGNQVKVLSQRKEVGGEKEEMVFDEEVEINQILAYLCWDLGEDSKLYITWSPQNFINISQPGPCTSKNSVT